jgi:predicted nucleotidyltransferase component of viral defense system
VTGSSDRLSPLQRELLAGFFSRTNRFFLSGGAALAGFYLAHRDTKDLDLFATGDVDIGEGADALVATARAVGATAKILRQSEDFRRYVADRGDEQTLVDLVIDRAPQVVAEKAMFGSIRVDPLREIAANKLCAVLDRVEPRDLVDLDLILQLGLVLADVVHDAQKKHAGADPATIAWMLRDFRIPATAPLPFGVDRERLIAFVDRLVRELTTLALPPE